MFPPVFQVLQTGAVIAIVGERIARHGDIAQDERRPYITWSIVIGNPHDNLSDAPPSDFTTVDINCWHTTDAGVEALALAVRDALDARLICNRVRVNQREPDTRLYRVGIEADFITQR
ncbi:tail completion protein gp17 [Lysobacter enzymogenes]|uniref:tail completion protein gp17 n=1 Tax=Lysobacter enzymogenes TaxID=69 RepID=UPI0008993E28|nr:DUF3168 domain-containing protein [Lysobacter enzymogenes]SDW95010.1 Protein of unknown function [Lysobacter enzymogenes]